jgi:hypothetical protein
MAQQLYKLLTESILHKPVSHALGNTNIAYSVNVIFLYNFLFHPVPHKNPIIRLHYVQELQELKEAHDEQPDDLASLQEAVEMATLDKEMAEEKVTHCMNVMSIASYNASRLLSILSSL